LGGQRETFTFLHFRTASIILRSNIAHILIDHDWLRSYRPTKAHHDGGEFMTKAAADPLPDLWNDAHAADLDEPGLLLYRSNLLGSDLRITISAAATPQPKSQ
jgi:hypothetical protein